MTSAYSAAVPWTGERAPGHDRGRLLTQVAAMVAGGGECVADLAALREPARPVRRGAVLDALRAARATARARVWEATGGPDEVAESARARPIGAHG